MRSIHLTNDARVKYPQLCCTANLMPRQLAARFSTALVVVGSYEFTETELLMPQCSDYVQTVFKNTKTGNGQKWLMLDVRSREIMDDVFSLINLGKRIPS